MAAVPRSPPEFADCPGEYRGFSDLKYLNCGVQPGEQFCQLLRDLHRAKGFRSPFLAVLPLFLASLCLLVNGLLGVLCLETLFRPRPNVGSKKRLLFLFSRSAATLAALLVLFAVLLAWHLDAFRFWTAALLFLAGVAQLLALAGSNLALGSLLYLAVVHPLFYRARVSMGCCLAVVGLFWAFSIGASIPFGLLSATLFYPQSAPLHCPFSRCQWPICLAMVLLLCSVFLCTLLCHSAMLWQMHRRTRRLNRIHPLATPKSGQSLTPAISRNLRAMDRLSLNLLAFSISKLPLLLISIIALANLERLSSLGQGEKSPCKTFLNGRLFFQLELLSCLAAVIWMLGMLLDPCIDLCADHRLRHLFTSRAKSLLLLRGRSPSA